MCSAKSNSHETMEMKNNRLEALEMKINQLDVKGTLMDLTDFHCFSSLRVRKDLVEKKEHVEKRGRKECREYVTIR